MHIVKIEIPAFRVLRDVALEFGVAYEPQIFPIGSENGGGKSTLLQLVFILLHCSADPTRFPYLENLLASASFTEDDSEHLIARLTLKIDQEHYALEFVSLTDRFLAERLDAPVSFGFDTESELRNARARVKQLTERLERLAEVSERYGTLPADRDVRYDSKLRDLLIDGSADAVARVTTYGMPKDVRGLMDFISKESDLLRSSLRRLSERHVALRADAEKIKGILVALDHRPITYYRPKHPGAHTRALICRCSGLSVSKIEEVLRHAASQIFLLGPSNQQYLFLNTSTRRALLGASTQPPRKNDVPKTRPQIEYLTKLDAVEGVMSGFYAYDWLSVTPLLKLFISARDEDFKNVVKTGSYGSSYTTLIREVNELLHGKKVRPLDDLSDVEFTVVDNQGTEVTLGSEDLSQGEMKRLMIYSWLRSNNAFNAVVLIDEIESSFHPDWQIGIVGDLERWAPKNQYLLATHSYELCRALTPGHVRELEPRLRKNAVADGESAVADGKGASE